MRKLTLKLDELSVKSFETVPDPDAARGTVRGQDASEGTGCDVSQCMEDTCGGTCGCPGTHYQEHTCDVMSCGGTCYISCAGTCGGCSEFHDVTCAQGNCP